MIQALSTQMQREIAQQTALSSALSDTQVQISTGKKLQMASDDPAAAARIASIKLSEANNMTWENNIAKGLSLNSQADTTMQTVSELMTQAKTLLVQASNGTQSLSDQASIAAQLTSISDQLDSLANIKDANGQPLFSQGTALAARYSSSDVFAAVPSQAEAMFVGGMSYAAIVSSAASAVSSGNTSQIVASLTAADNGVSNAADVSAKIGLAANKLQAIQTRLSSEYLTMENERSGLEDTDVSAAIAKLNQQTLTLQAAQAAFARINRQTLFDVLGP
jgi:flagellar hook-associated protein 3 FlgL